MKVAIVTGGSSGIGASTARELSKRGWAAARTPFGTIGQYVGANIPGKPRRYLLNAAGRPKLFEMIAEVAENDYEEFGLSRSSTGLTERAG